MAAAMHELLFSNGLTAALDRANRRRFSSNLHHFVANMRGVLRTR